MKTLHTKRALRRLARQLAAAATDDDVGGGVPLPPTRPNYRVEHRRGDAVAVVADATDGAPHHATLEVFLSRVRNATDPGGDLVLVDDATGAVVARRRIDSRGRHRRQRPRK